MNASPSLVPLITESERVLAEAISYFRLAVKASQIIVTIQYAGRVQAYGWFAADRWKNGKPEAIHEINLSAEHIKEMDIGEVLLHELAHAENKQLGIKDCSGPRHNRQFKRRAELLGLEVDEPDDSVGYGITKLGSRGAEFLESIAFKRELFSICRLGAIVAKPAPGSRLVKWECPDCGYTMRLTRKWLSKSEPRCPTCDDSTTLRIPEREGESTLTENEIAQAAEADLIKIEKINGQWRLVIHGGRSVIWEARNANLRTSVEDLWAWMKEANFL